MRSIPRMAATTVIVALAWACGDNGSGVQPGKPVATFTAPTNCTAGAACTFTDASTPAGEITAWSWTFGDDPAAAPDTRQNPDHTYQAAGTYDVTLTVTSANGTDDVTNKVTVAGPANPPPTASFSAPSCGAGIDCTFLSTSSDVAPGSIVTTHWNFGDANSTSNEADGVQVTHRYAQAGDYTVALTVTDDGGAVGTTSQTVTVGQVAASDCPVTGKTVTCALNIAQAGGVKLTLTSRDCELSGNRVGVVEPTPQVAFLNICSRAFPADYTVTQDGAGGAPATFTAGQVLHVTFTQGIPGPTDPAVGTPAARLRGTSPNWTITIDDGGNPTSQNEPDFNDVVISVSAGQP
jgi:PKD repeat protein